MIRSDSFEAGGMLRAEAMLRKAQEARRSSVDHVQSTSDRKMDLATRPLWTQSIPRHFSPSSRSACRALGMVDSFSMEELKAGTNSPSEGSFDHEKSEPKSKTIQVQRIGRFLESNTHCFQSSPSSNNGGPADCNKPIRPRAGSGSPRAWLTDAQPRKAFNEREMHDSYAYNSSSVISGDRRSQHSIDLDKVRSQLKEFRERMLSDCPDSLQQSGENRGSFSIADAKRANRVKSNSWSARRPASLNLPRQFAQRSGSDAAPHTTPSRRLQRFKSVDCLSLSSGEKIWDSPPLTAMPMGHLCGTGSPYAAPHGIRRLSGLDQDSIFSCGRIFRFKSSFMKGICDFSSDPMSMVCLLWLVVVSFVTGSIFSEWWNRKVW